MRRSIRWSRWEDVVGTVGGVGLAPVAPGTAGSAVAAAAYLILPLPLLVWAVAVLLASVVGVVAATRMERRFGPDPSVFVLDEVVGMWLALLGSPRAFLPVLLGFLLFRAADIVKPPPVRQAERLPAGLGVVADDLVAGALAWAALALLRLFGLWG